MGAISSIARLRDAGMDPWRAAIYADHYAAECVLVGGARRAARMATKTWRDKTIFDFIDLKRGGFLWSSNNSVTIDDDFRERASRVAGLLLHVETRFKVSAARKLYKQHKIDETDVHAFKVLMALAEASYFDGTGEPGIINQDRLTQKGNINGRDEVNGVAVHNTKFDYTDGLFAESAKYQIDKLELDPKDLRTRNAKSSAQKLMSQLSRIIGDTKYQMITNPCGELSRQG